jgi:hypothetical protein
MRESKGARVCDPERFKIHTLPTRRVGDRRSGGRVSGPGARIVLNPQRVAEAGRVEPFRTLVASGALRVGTTRGPSQRAKVENLPRVGTQSLLQNWCMKSSTVHSELFQ